MNILYLSTQYPGFGGAATEAYETIKRLRKLGHGVTGIFVDHCGHCPRGRGCGRPDVETWADPDRIGGIIGMKFCEQERIKNIVNGSKHRQAAWDVVVGKNYLAAQWAALARCPSVYITSGIDYISLIGKEAVTIAEAPPAGGYDLRAMSAVKAIICHSTLDAQLIAKTFPKELFGKIYSKVVFTPNIAVRSDADRNRVPYSNRQYDLCFSASNWDRTMKNVGLALGVCRQIPEKQIVVCGMNFRSDQKNVNTVGLLSHSQMLRIMENSRVVAIPSLYDPSPNLYAEAIACGCNVVVNKNVGNIEGHPKGLIAKSLNVADFLETVNYALSLESQEIYNYLSAEDAAVQLADALSDIAKSNGKSIFGLPSNVISALPKKAKPVDALPENLVRLLKCSCGSHMIQDGCTVKCCSCKFKAKIDRGVVDFTSNDAYVESFSNEWDKNRFTQVDSHGFKSGYQGEVNSEISFGRKTMLSERELAGKIFIDGGCGVGRYAEVAIKKGGWLVCADLSQAVYHCASLMKENGVSDRVLCIKGSLDNLPIADNAVDGAFSIGVIHHTANPLKTMKELHRVIKPAGVMAGWVYQKYASYGSPERDKVRKFTTDPKNFDWVWKFAQMAPTLRDLWSKDRNIWCQFAQVMGISTSTNDAECVLDTFDWLTPTYQYQYTKEEFYNILSLAGFRAIQMGDLPVNFKAVK